MLHQIGLTAVVLLTAWPAVAEYLPLIQVRDGATVSYWWSDAARPELTPLDAALLDARPDVWLNPVAPDRPTFSQRYGSVDITDLSARNLAGLYGADGAVRGEVALNDLVPVADGLLWTATVHLDVRLLDVGSELVRVHVSRSFSGHGANSEKAFNTALAAAARYVSDVLDVEPVATSLTLPDATVPTLLVHADREARLLVALKGDLRANELVVADIWEAWASEGVIALEVDLAAGADVDSLADLVYTIEQQTAAVGSTSPYRLTIEGREGLALRVFVTPPPPTDTFETAPGEGSVP